MTYDSDRHVVVLFGGLSGTTSAGDTWEWDGTGWNQVADSGPSPRWVAALAYDRARHVAVLFGGWDGNADLGDTWEWNGTQWTLRATDGPAPRGAHRLAYDRQRHVTILFGGWDGDDNFGDTWEWDGETWSLRSTSGPSPRRGHGLAYDTDHHVTVLFGGWDGSDDLGDTWVWDGQRWSLQATGGPAARGYHALVYDTAREVAVLFAGWEGTANFDDTWLWEGTDPLRITDQPTDETVPVGGTIALSVDADGTGTLHYRWYQNGDPLTDDDRISGAHTRHLTIAPARLDDSGSYTVVVTDDCDELESDSAAVTVYDAVAPIVVITAPTSEPTYEVSGSPVHLAGTADDNVAVIGVTWFNAATAESGACAGTTSWACDVPLVSGENPVTVTAHDASENQGSDQITLIFFDVEAGDGRLEGKVIDADTGAPLADVRIVFHELERDTGPSGNFLFVPAPAGAQEIALTKEGYFPETLVVHIGAGSPTHLVVEMLPVPTGDLPQVVGVTSQYVRPGTKTYFLDGVPLEQAFTARVQWNGHAPGIVRWATPYVSFEGPCPGMTVSRTLDVGGQFGPHGTLMVTAISGDEPPIESLPCEANMKVLSPPPLGTLIPGVEYALKIVGQEIEYDLLGIQGVTVGTTGWGADRMPADFPIFGGWAMGLDPQFDMSGVVHQDGTMDLFTVGFDASQHKNIRKGVPTRNHKGCRLPFLEVAVTGTYSQRMVFVEREGAWQPSGWLDLGVSAKIDSPQFPFPPPASVLYGRAEIEMSAVAHFPIVGWVSDEPGYAGGVDFEPVVRAILGAGKAKALCAEGWVGGGFHAEGVELSPECAWDNAYAIMLFGGRLLVGPFVSEFEVRRAHPERLDPGTTPSSESWTPFTLLPRERSRGSCPTRPGPSGTTRGTAAEEALVIGEFPYSVPGVIRAGETPLAVWIADNTERDLINRTELTFATHDANGWSEPTPVAGDGTADLSPQLAALPDGHAVCIWQDANAVLSDEDPFEVFLSHLEIAVSAYDPQSGTWSPVTRLTDDAALDRSPSVAAAAGDDMLAAWVTNAGNDLWGTSELPNDIRWSVYDGVEWAPPAVLAAGLGTILDTTLAYDGTTGYFVFVTDADENLDTQEDQELWAATYADGQWSAPVQLTSDAICDAAPRLAYDPGGVLRLAWLKGDDLRFATGLDVGNSTVVATPGASPGARDFDLVMGSAGQVALAWNDVSATYLDLWVAYYDPTLDVWSAPRQLTADDSAERFVSGAFDAAGNLLCVYDKTQTVYVDREEWVNGQLVVVEDVPQAGQSDLYYMMYTLGVDLAVAVEDVNVQPLNPFPGTLATLSALVHNLGEAPADNIAVAFYEGDPGAGGTLIGAALLSEPLAGGDSAEATIAWNVPTTTEPVQVHVVVDPNFVQDDRDRTSNAAAMPVLAPDLTISEVVVQAAGPHRFLTARVANEGALTVASAEVVMRRGSATGPVLATLTTTAPVVAGAYHDLAWVWEDVPLLYGGRIDVFATVDEAHVVDEFDEDNNVRSASVTGPAAPLGDFDVDGNVDLDDYNIFAGCMLGPEVQYLSGCAYTDLETDGDVDLADLAVLQSAFGG
ncbi:MAG TPA: CARDB domain-containing protein [Phycisphaerae bacterium]|nr:CARDB domain-containing protein [Phycisphaerae bacterium]HNU44984.1 CARDB domain-containing protein [Phycisphaerae bacterium]